MKTLFLHVGLDKTGSSSIQRFLNNNREELAGANILYPEIGKTVPNAINHFLLYFCFQRQEHHLCPPNPPTPSVIWEKVIEKGIAQNSNILVSCEAFINLPIDSFLLIKEIASKEYIIKPIVYLRRVDEYIKSSLNQRIKEESLSSKKINVRNVITQVGEKYQKVIELIELFGKENVLVRPFEKEQFYKGDLISDFMFNCLDIEDSANFKRLKEFKNISLGQNTLEYKRIMNTLEFSLRQRNSLLPLLYDYGIRNQDKKELFFQNEISLELIKGLWNFEKKIAAQCLNNLSGKLFIDKLPDETEEYDPFLGVSLQVVLDISNFILQSKGLIKGKLQDTAWFKKGYADYSFETVDFKLNSEIIKEVMDRLFRLEKPQKND